MKVTVTTDHPDLSAAIRAAIANADPALTSMLEAIGAEGADLARTGAPGSKFVDSIDYEVRPDGVTVGSQLKIAHIVERGRRPGRMANVAVIGRNFGLDHSEAFTAARAIGRHGTKGHHTFERVRASIQPEVNAAAAEFVKEIELSKRGR